MAERAPLDFPDSVREYVSALEGVPVSENLGARVQQRASQKSPHARQQTHGRRILWPMAMGAVAAAAGITLVTIPFLKGPTRVGGFALEHAADAQQLSTATGPAASGRVVTVLAPQLVLGLPEQRTTVVAHRHTRMRREGADVRIMTGIAEFSVGKRQAAAQPFRVIVSAGAIEVRGTRFLVVEAQSSGYVTLYEGAITFYPDERQPQQRANPVTMKPGDTLAWPTAEETSVPEPQSTSKPKPVLTKPASAEARRAASHGQNRNTTRLLDEIDELRIRQSYDRMTARIAEVLPQLGKSPLAESLSYERCDVLIRRGTDVRRACQALADHVAAFPGGRYDKLVRSAQAAFACDTSK